MRKNFFIAWLVVGVAMLVGYAAPLLARTWHDTDFANRPLYAYPLPHGRDNIIGSLTTYKIEHGDTLLDVGRWFGLSAKEVSDANGHLDWWGPPADKVIVLPSEHILPEGPHVGIVMNIPEMRIYYYYPYIPPHRIAQHRVKGKLTKASYASTSAQVVYTFPVGLGRFDWRTPVATWRVTAKVKDPTWVVPQDIYEEHLERDGEAEHVIPGGVPENPLGRYKLALSLPEYALHGTDVPWGVGMSVSHGCVRLYPEDIERLFSKTKVGTPGRFVYQPVKFGWRGGSLYVEVHDDLYARYPGLWNHAVHEAARLGLSDDIDAQKLEKAVELKSGVPTYVMPGPDPSTGLETAALEPSAPPSAPPPTLAPSAPARVSTAAMIAPASGNAATARPAGLFPVAHPVAPRAISRPVEPSESAGFSRNTEPNAVQDDDSPASGAEWEGGLPSRVVGGDDDVQ